MKNTYIIIDQNGIRSEVKAEKMRIYEDGVRFFEGVKDIAFAPLTSVVICQEKDNIPVSVTKGERILSKKGFKQGGFADIINDLENIKVYDIDGDRLEIKEINANLSEGVYTITIG